MTNSQRVKNYCEEFCDTLGVLDEFVLFGVLLLEVVEEVVVFEAVCDDEAGTEDAAEEILLEVLEEVTTDTSPKIRPP